ncbi:hypothetical protein ALQ39_02790, partial [Pseudomonas amygdali pv. eriobotryae]
SAASFKRSALLMYLALLCGASFALAFFAWAFSSCCIFYDDSCSSTRLQMRG